MRTFLDEEAPGEPLVLVPEVDGGGAALEVHLAVRVEQLVELDLHVSQLLRRQEAVLDGGLVCVGPWGSVW